MTVLEFNDVRRGYARDVNVLNGVSFSVEAGEVVGLLGKNGAGKTTLMRIAMGLLETQRGAVSVFGFDPEDDAAEVKRRVGYVSEENLLPPFLRVHEAIELHRGLFPTWDDSLASRLGSRFDLPSRARIKTLSKGQARQLALICALAHRPALLLLDEPAGGLDPAARLEFLEASIELINESGSTILFSSHHMRDVERMAGRVVMIHDGKVLMDRDLDSLREAHSLALVPHEAEVTRDRLLALDDCVGVRQRSDAMHAILRLDPDRASSMLGNELGVSEVRCTRIGLEEMFVELVGGGS
jgi:ABC-2 type transport system ATP-binding protein